MQQNRRDFIRALTALGLASAAKLSVGCRGSRAPGTAAPATSAGAVARRALPPRPRHLVFFHLRGGMDAILTTCPKRPKDVDQHVDLPYQPNEIFSVNGKEYGPQIKPAEKHLGEIAVLNGVYSGSVQHDYGGAQLLRMKRNVAFDVPTIAQVIGDHMRAHPLPSIAIGQVDPEGGFYPPGLLQCTLRETDPRARDLCDDIINMTPEQLNLAAEGLDQLAASPDGGPEVAHSSRSMAAFMRRIASGLPKPQTELWIPEFPVEQQSLSYQRPRRGIFQRDCMRALWMLEHELVTAIHIQPRGIMWDSHTNNFPQQTKMNTAFFPVFARFLEELKVRKNSHGTLASQTLVVLGSELGRLPRLNDRKGKDHFPEMPMMFWGPRVKTKDREGRNGVVFGSIGRRMESQPIDEKYGLASATGSVPTLDDVGATVLAAFDIQPHLYGYGGRPLRFLMEV